MRPNCFVVPQTSNGNVRAAVLTDRVRLTKHCATKNACLFDIIDVLKVSYKKFWKLLTDKDMSARICESLKWNVGGIDEARSERVD